MIAPLRQIPGTALVPDEVRVRASVGAIRAVADGDSAESASLASILLAEGESGTESAEAAMSLAMRKSGSETVSGVKTFAGGIVADVVRGDVMFSRNASAASVGGRFSRIFRRSELVGLITLGRVLRDQETIFIEDVNYTYLARDGIRAARRLIEDFEAKSGGMTLGDVWATLLSALVGVSVRSGVGVTPDASVVENAKKLLAKAVVDYIRAKQSDGGYQFMPPDGHGSSGDTIAGRVFGLAARAAALAREVGKCTTAVVVPNPATASQEGG